MSIRSLLWLSLVVSSLLASTSALIAIRAELYARTVPEVVARERLTRSELQSRAERAEAAAQKLFSRSATAVRAANYYELLAARELTSTAKISAMCKQLSTLGLALSRRPQNARLLVSWANVRQALGSYDCGLEFTTGEYRSAIEYALEQNQVSPQVLYSGAILYVFAGEREKAWPLFRRMITLSQGVPDFQRQFILSQLQSSEDVKALVPTLFPHVAEWAGHLKQSHPELFERSRSVLADAQRQAIDRDIREFQRGVVPVALHRDRLLSLTEVTATDSVRRKLDGALANLFRAEGVPPLVEYFASRGRLQEYDVVRASIAGDTRPLKASFVSWSNLDDVSVNDFYRSIGFFVPAGKKPSLIQLWGPELSSGVETSRIKIYVSNDNQDWEEVYAKVSVSGLKVHRTPVVSIKVDLPLYKYWKIHYEGADRQGDFRGPLQSLLRVYGL